MGILDSLGLKKSLGGDPKNLWEMFFKSVTKSEWSKALQLLNKLKELEPDNSQVHMKLGDVLQRKGNKSGAIEAYHAAASCLDDSINTQKALAMYKVILRLDPEDEEAINKSRAAMKTLGWDTDKAKAKAAPAPATKKAPKSFKEALKNHPILSVLSDEEIKELPKKVKVLLFKNNQPVIKEDAEGNSIYVINEGSASVTSTILEKTFELATLNTWDFFGESGFLTGMARSATVTAVGDLKVIEFTKILLDEIIESNPKVLERLVEISQSREKDRVGIVENKG
jgi:tetratricopeptide (TPR) repeat protein